MSVSDPANPPKRQVSAASEPLTDGPSVALIGGGFLGRQLAAAFVHGGARIIAIADPNIEAIGDLCDETGARCFADVAALFATLRPELALIATPNHVHLEPALAAIRAGCATFVEKPLALTAADCEAMVSAARARSVPLFVGHVQRTLPGIGTIRSLIGSGALGTIVAARGSRQRWLMPKGATADWWKLDRLRSGGELLHELHELDLLCWLIGPVKEVFARARNRVHPQTPACDDVIQLSLELESGALATVEIGTAYHRRDWGLVIHGELGSVHVDFVESTVRHFRADGTVETLDLFGETDADLSLREFGISVQNYNMSGAKAAYWMTRAVQMEAASVISQLRGGTPSVLEETPTEAVEVALAANASTMTGNPRAVANRRNLVSD